MGQISEDGSRWQGHKIFDNPDGIRIKDMRLDEFRETINELEEAKKFVSELVEEGAFDEKVEYLLGKEKEEKEESIKDKDEDRKEVVEKKSIELKRQNNTPQLDPSEFGLEDDEIKIESFEEEE